jgi:uncharacterized cupin superfamily protein
MTIDDVLGANLATGRPVPTAVAGEPYESWHVISDDGQVELGIWEVTPGSFRGRRTASTNPCTSSPGAARSRTEKVS